MWHRRDLLALNLSRVDFLLGESQHPRVPRPQLGALGGPLASPRVLGQLEWPVTPPQGCCYLQGMLVPQKDAGTPPQRMLLPTLGMLVPILKECCYTPRMLVPCPGDAPYFSGHGAIPRPSWPAGFGQARGRKGWEYPLAPILSP